MAVSTSPRAPFITTGVTLRNLCIVPNRVLPINCVLTSFFFPQMCAVCYILTVYCSRPDYYDDYLFDYRLIVNCSTMSYSPLKLCYYTPIISHNLGYKPVWLELRLLCYLHNSSHYLSTHAHYAMSRSLIVSAFKPFEG